MLAIERTMVADAKVIKQAEVQLYEFQKESGFTSLLLKVISNEDVPLNVRMSAAIYFKNKVQRSWIVYEDASKKGHMADDITESEQEVIKENIPRIIADNANNNHVRPHLTEAVNIILTRSKGWNLTPTISELLNSGKRDYILTGLLLTFEMCKVHRYDMCGSRNTIDTFISEIFPIIEAFLPNLVEETDYSSSELLYLIIKSFKYACLNNYPQYFNDVEKLNMWIQLHLFICSKPLPKEVAELDPSDALLDKRVKVNKWGFGNLNRFIHRFSKSTKNITEDFVNYVFVELTPKMVEHFFTILQSWNDGTFYLSDSSLYHLIQFLEKCLITDALYPLIESHLGAIIQNLIFKCLCANQLTAELFETDPEEYTRRFFDFNKEGSTADVASTDFIFVVGHKRPEQLSVVLPFINEVLNEFSSKMDDVECAYKQEGAMRTISSLFSFFESSDDNLEGIFSHYIIDLLSQEKYPFLVARALETIASYQYEFKDMNTLSKLYELAYNHLTSTDILPIQIEAADALKTLVVSNPSIHEHISSQVPMIMDRLLKLSKVFEIDILAEVMESFVERFADELTPFARELASNLAEQFLKLAQSMVENNAHANNGYGVIDQDQELQASSLLQTMTTMVLSMNKVSLINEFTPVCKFVIQNAQISIITESVDLMDALAMSSKTLHEQFVPEIWDIFSDILDSFQTYAMDYFDCYSVFFESVVLFGFPTNQTFVEPFMRILAIKLDGGIDYDIENVFNLLQLYTISMKTTPLFAECLKVANNDELEIDHKETLKLFAASLYIRPLETLQTCEMEGMTLQMITVWLEQKVSSVYGIKLQIMALLSLFKLSELPLTVVGFIPQLVNMLVTLLERLPTAIKNHEAINKEDSNLLNSSSGSSGGVAGLDTEAEGLDVNPEDEDEYLEDYEDDFKETALDSINAFEEVYNFFDALRTQNVERYEQLANALNEEKKQSLQVILEFVSQKN